MPVRIYTTGAGCNLSPAEIAILRELCDRNGRAVLLVPTFDERAVCRRDLGKAGLGLGVDVETVASWTASLWGLLGDGRAIASSTERKLLMSGVLGEAAQDPGGVAPFADNPGTADMLVKMAAAMLPRCLDAAGGAYPDVAFSAAERRTLGLLVRYADRLRAQGLIEACAARGQLVRALDDNVPVCASAVAVRGFSSMEVDVLDLFACIARVGEVVVLEGRDQESLADLLTMPLGASVDDFPTADPELPATAAVELAGPGAREAACTQILSQMAASGAMLACATPDPYRDFLRMAPRLAAKGMSCRFAGSVPFARTRSGQMLFMLVDLLDRMNREQASSWWPAPELVEWIRSPLSGVGPARRQTVMAFDTMLRRNRRLTVADVLSQLNSIQSRELNAETACAEAQRRAARPVVAMDVVEALQQERYSRALRLMHAAAQAAPAAAFGACGLSAQMAELAALERADELLGVARSLGVDESRVLEPLRGLSVHISIACTPVRQDVADAAETGAPAVIFATVDELSRRSHASYDGVLLADMGVAEYQAKERDTVASILAQKLGCATLAIPAGERQLAQFSRALESAGSRAVLCRIARDRQGEELFAIPAFGELSMRAKRVGKAMDALSVPGEGALFANMDATSGEGLCEQAVAALGRAELLPEVRSLVMLLQRSVGGNAVPRTLSASSIENYLACPFRWFTSNRVPTRKFDCAFSPVEMGNFVHDVMQRFHERLIDCGLKRVTPDNLDACMDEMDAAFAETREEHARGRYLYGRRAENKDARKISAPLVALDQLESYAIDAILTQLRKVVCYESTLLAIYEPALFEYAFDRENVSYAGYPLGGRIDRVDVAPDAGSGERFVVIDYKNRSVASYFKGEDPTRDLEGGEELEPGWLPGLDEDRSPHVQTLIYATALERLGQREGRPRQAQGAVYFGTRRAGISGAVSASLWESEGIPNDRPCVFPGPPKGRGKNKKEGSLEFEELLDLVEQSIAAELSRCAEGGIAPAPHRDSCSFCPVTMCEKRRS